jgi:hypothetical protein
LSQQTEQEQSALDSERKRLIDLATPRQWAKFFLVAVLATVLLTTGTLYAVASWTDILPRGETGAQGALGFRGERGQEGRRGPEGPEGPRGFPGDNGFTGDQGANWIVPCSDDIDNPIYTETPPC